MNCCQCQGIEELFNEKEVRRELEQYRKKGPAKTTRMMIGALQKMGVEGATLLDIGGGVGSIQHALLSAGAQSAVDVDASKAYLRAAAEEAAQRGLSGRVHFQHGNFVDLAPQIPPADIVTLDRVICCYDDMWNLVNRSAEKAQKLYAVVYPRDSWWAKLAIRVLNFFFRLQRSPFRTFVHPTRAVEDILHKFGLRRVFYSRTLVWQVAVYQRS